MKPGDVVYLKSGSPAMTIKVVANDYIEAVYFLDRFCHQLFTPDMLELAEDFEAEEETFIPL